MTEREDAYERARLDKVERMRAAGRDPYPLTFDRTHTAKAVRARAEPLQPGEETTEKATVAGRLMLHRSHGAVSFGTIRDATGDIQLFVQRDHIGADGYESFKELDLGDWVGAAGEIVKTKKGEPSVKTNEIVLLAKALRPLPKEWYGLKDTEQRFRRRELDFILNPDARRIARMRSAMVGHIRDFLHAKGFMEVETPMLQVTPGGALAKPFVTHMNALDLDLYLRIAPELYLKRLIVAGFDRVFEINRNFRNEGISPRHNPEFTMLEAYQAFTDYVGMMELTEELVTTVARKTLDTTGHTHKGRPMNLKGPFPRRRLIDLVSEATKRQIDLGAPIQQVQQIAGAHGVPYDPAWGPGKLVLEMYEKLVEHTLWEPTFVLDFPREVSPLARPHRDDERFTEHFDLVVAGTEIGVAYSELNDPVDQRERFQDQARLRAAGDEEAMTLDDDFLLALEQGMPPTGGLGFGIDRFLAVLADAQSIREVMLFPLMRPEGGQSAPPT